MIIALLAGAGPLSLEVIRVEVGLSERWARELITALINRGYVRRGTEAAFTYETTGLWNPDDDVRAL